MVSTIAVAQTPPPPSETVARMPPLPSGSAAQPPATPGLAQLHLELPLLEVPDNVVHGGAWPSMGQSLWGTTDLYELMHFGLGRALGVEDGSHPTLGALGIAVADFVTLELPGFLAWEHEEWHRAVLAQYGIHSFDDVYNLQLFSSEISVSHVADADLVALKRDHPADQVRLSSAGIEGNYELATNLERVSFLHPEGPSHTFLLWLLYVENVGYLDACTGQQSNDLTDQANQKEGTNVPVRDFTGLDCDGWVYDLFRPDEPYAARGVHPSGVGIDRYRKWSQLTPAEQELLSLQVKLGFLNFLDPQLLGFHAFEGTVGGRPLAWNASVRHQQTAAGHILSLNVALRRELRNLFLSASAHFSDHLLLPGLDAQTWGAPLTFAGQPWRVSARAAMWLQPRGLRWDATGPAPGGLVSVRLAWAGTPRLQPYVELEAKSEGWVAGNVHLGPQAAGRVGIVSLWSLR